jgi:kinesin family protein 11
VDEQVKDIETQMRALDDFVTRARSQNSQHHDSHVQSLQSLSATVNTSYTNIGTHFTSTYERVRDLGDEMSTQAATMQQNLAPLDSVLRQPLSELRENIAKTAFHEYQPTGETPQKTQYIYPTELPRTEAHEDLIAAMRRPFEASRSPSKSMGPGLISLLPVIFNDEPNSASPTRSRPFSKSLPAAGMLEEELERPTTSDSTSLREVDVNANMVGGAMAIDTQVPNFKRSVSGAGGKLPVLKNKKSIVQLEGRENINILAQSTGRRRSPRTAN